MINCSSCGAANRSSSRFCQACGVAIDLIQPVRCPQCGTPNPAASAFCTTCEARLPRPHHPETSAEAAGAADEAEPARTAAPGAGGGTLPVWVRGPEDAFRVSDHKVESDSDESSATAAEPVLGSDVARSATVASTASTSSPASPADSAGEPPPPDEEPAGAEEPGDDEGAQDAPPDWLKELPARETGQTISEAGPQASRPPDWLESLEPRPLAAGLGLGLPELSPRAATLPGWLREWRPGAAEPEEGPRPGGVHRVEVGDAGGLQPVQAGERVSSGPARDPVPAQSEDLKVLAVAAMESRHEKASDESERSDLVADWSANAGELLGGVKAALAAKALVSTPDTLDPPGASALPIAAAAARARLFGKIVSSPAPTSDDTSSHGSSHGESFLALDCGRATTRAFLFDRVDGAHRFVAHREVPSTAGPPSFDPLLSVRRALSALADTSGGAYLDGEGQLVSPRQQGRGIDALVAVQSIVPALRLILAGASDAIGLDHARRAASATGSEIVGTVSLDGVPGTSSGDDDLQGQVRLVLRTVPDAIIFVAIGDGVRSDPVLDALRAVALSSSSQPADRRPAIILLVDDPELRSKASAVAGTGTIDLRFPTTEPGTSGEAGAGWLLAELEEIARERWAQHGQGLATVAAWSAAPILPAWRAFGLSLQYLAQRSAETVLGVDIGAAHVTVAAAANGSLDLLVRGDLGMAHDVARVPRLAPAGSMRRWLPFDIDSADITNRLYNKALRPGTLPQTRHDLLLEQAAAREIVRLALADCLQSWPQHRGLLTGPDVIVGSGGVLASAPSYGQALLILVDALQPVGISRLYLDRDRLAMVAGAVATVDSLAASQILEHDGLLCLGTVVTPLAPEAHVAEGEASLTVKVTSEGGRVRVVGVPCRGLGVVPLAAGQTATVEVLSGSGSGVPFGPSGQTGPVEVLGGAIGIIVDARGRPIPVAEEPAEQRRRVQSWLRAVGA